VQEEVDWRLGSWGFGEVADQLKFGEVGARRKYSWALVSVQFGETAGEKRYYPLGWSRRQPTDQGSVR
jgi:hypothetical protein